MMKNLDMKKVLINFVIVLMISMSASILSSVQATVIEGGINTNERVKGFCRVIDKHTKKPVANALVSVPSKNFTAYTDINGQFELKPLINGQTILSVSKSNYKPFSMTISREVNANPFVVEIETSTPFDIRLETALCHLGDNNFSGVSANAGQFKGVAVGPVYNKSFNIPVCSQTKQPYLVIGSIIGIDTALARGMGQNGITTSFASPPSVYLNGHKIAEIQINGDNQKIRLPKQFIRFNQQNVITIKAGRNLMQTAYVDYDDIEFMNLSIQVFDASTQQLTFR